VSTTLVVERGDVQVPAAVGAPGRLALAGLETGAGLQGKTGAEAVTQNRSHSDRGVGSQAEGDRGSRNAHRADLEALRDRDQEQDRREHHCIPQVALGGVTRGGALVERRRGERVQPGRGLKARVPVLRHDAGPGRCGGVGERISLLPGKKAVRCKTTNVERLELAVASGMSPQPKR
jgi:hypothetical protein